MSGGEEEETRAAIMEATYDALVERGYADLTIQAIADEFEKSKSLLYYHFDSKEDILRAFLGYLLEEFSGEMDEATLGSDPEADLRQLLEMLLPRELDDEERALRLALVDLQVQAAYEQTYRESVGDLLVGLREALAAVLRAGVEDGTFREDVDPEREADLLFAAVSGASFNGLTVLGGSHERVRDAVDAHVERLLAD